MFGALLAAVPRFGGRDELTIFRLLPTFELPDASVYFKIKDNFRTHCLFSC